jgi:hypothetical protein
MTNLLTRPIKIVLVLVVVLVLDQWGWSGVLEYCAFPGLHPRSGLKLLIRRFVLAPVSQPVPGRDRVFVPRPRDLYRKPRTAQIQRLTRFRT